MDSDIVTRLENALGDHRSLLIIPHNDPDPDAIASALGLQHLIKELFAVEAQIAYCGIIGRAENKALVRYLNYPLRRLDHYELTETTPVALVDTQPGAGNNPLSDDITPLIVVDHHDLRQESRDVRFGDVRQDVGASSTIVTGYLQAADLEPPSALATALFYGIKTDTMSLGRGAGPDDIAAYFYLQPRIDVDALVTIERARVPASYFESLAKAIQAARLYDRDLLIAFLDSMNYPDLGAEIADLLLRLERIKWVICLGVFNDDIILSVRSRSHRIGASELVRSIVGTLGTAGGHGAMAGGQIPIEDGDESWLVISLKQNALRYLGKDSEQDGTPLIKKNC